MNEAPRFDPADNEAQIVDPAYHLHCLELVRKLSTDDEPRLLNATVSFGEHFGRVWRARFVQSGENGSVVVQAICWNDNGNTAMDVSILPGAAQGEQ